LVGDDILPLTNPTEYDMPISFEDTGSGVRLIKLSGRMDIAGTGQIEIPFASASCAEKLGVVVDLSAVDFLASIGIRCLITNAKAQHNRGGKFVLFVGDNAQVAKTLETTGIDALIPMFRDSGEARAAVA
jgi:anti-anti-sigma factor